jgi:hypothetical protein
MGAFFTVGEQKIRPGTYIRYENTGTPAEVAITNGVCAAVFKANWGPLGVAIDIENLTDVETYFGSALTVDIIKEILKSGVKVKAVRLGSGGTKGTYTLKDTAGTPADVIRIDCKYPGSRALSLTLRDSLTDSEKRELLILEGTAVKQKIEFAKGENEVDALVDAVAESGSNWITATKLAAGNGILATLTQQAITPGTDPNITNSDYSNAFNVLESQKWNVLAVDTDDTEVHILMQGFISRVFSEGKLVMGVVGEPTSVAFATRKTNAAALNDFCMIYVLNGFIDSTGAVYEGYKAAARVAGMIAAAPSNNSLTHKVISGAVALKETLTNPQIEQALQSGAIVFTTNSNGQVQIEYGINTLVTTSANQDAGWKKIRRVKTRFELMERITAATEQLIGNVDNDNDGRATIMAAAQGIINKMAAEGKLLPGGTIEVDPNNPPVGDSAWFKISVDDLDSAEKLYFTFGFRFAPETNS